MPSSNHPSPKKPKPAGFHPRNLHQGHYDFAALIAADANRDYALAHYVQRNEHGEQSIDFADARAVKALNRALLKLQYGINDWDIPEDYLCPPVPGRADYIHGLADLLSAANQGKAPKKNSVQVVDIGTGANGIYPLIGSRAYTWNFVATDINTEALTNLQKLVNANPQLANKIRLRHQAHRDHIFQHILQNDEWFDLSMCNPPFHTSATEAHSGTNRKWQNLGKTHLASNADLNFGGQAAELWCPGGELQFISKMMDESRQFATQCFWFTSLISKSAHLDPLKAKLKQVKALEQRVIHMQQGSKQSRFIAWTFLTPAQQLAWAKLRWRS